METTRVATAMGAVSYMYHKGCYGVSH